MLGILQVAFLGAIMFFLMQISGSLIEIKEVLEKDE